MPFQSKASAPSSCFLPPKSKRPHTYIQINAPKVPLAVWVSLTALSIHIPQVVIIVLIPHLPALVDSSFLLLFLPHRPVAPHRPTPPSSWQRRQHQLPGSEGPPSVPQFPPCKAPSDRAFHVPSTSVPLQASVPVTSKLSSPAFLSTCEKRKTQDTSTKMRAPLTDWIFKLEEIRMRHTSCQYDPGLTSE